MNVLVVGAAAVAADPGVHHRRKNLSVRCNEAAGGEVRLVVVLAGLLVATRAGILVVTRLLHLHKWMHFAMTRRSW